MGKEPNVPELWDAYEVAQEEVGTIRRLFTAYLYQIEKLIELNEQDLAIIARAQEIRSHSNSSQGSASHVSIIDFYTSTLPEQREKIRDFIVQMSNPDSQLFQEALQVLSTMMHNGHVMKTEGRIPRDGDEESDRVIWGHTQLVDQLTLIEFTICHFMERCMTVAFQQEGLEMANHKDWFLNLLTDIITYNVVRGERFTNHIGNAWQEPRTEGGLGWIKEERLNAFREAVTQET